jgi:hypothetical protein
MPDGVVAIASHDRLAWLRIVDGHFVGHDQVWFPIERLVQHEGTLVVQGAGGLACYRNGTRTWGLVGVKQDPTALIFTNMIAWTADAHGRPLKPAGSLRAHEDAALVLGSSVTQIDRRSPSA